MSHRPRAPHDVRCPVHATLRLRRDLPSLRGDRMFSAVRDALAAASSPGFRLLHFSVQRDHLHVLVEADAPGWLARGLQGLAIRVAKAVNRTLGRHGAVFDDRYHARTLATPREVRNAFVYVLNNWRKHVRHAIGLDDRSSARWFDGWRVAPSASAPPPVARARTWLARVGWRRHGMIDVDEAPQRER
jgi:putative transposase